MLRLEGVSGGYGRRPVIRDVDLTVGAGETVALLGANTAGKTTLIRAVMGALPRVSGALSFEGVSILRRPPHHRARLGVALVPEGRHVFKDMTVEDNLLMGAYHRRRELDAETALAECFAFFPRLEERRRQRAGTLSGGEQQMAAICRALMSKPKLLLLDEPSHGLAPLMAAEVRAAIGRINAQGVSVLLVEQNVAASLEIVERGYVLENGRIALEGTTRALSENAMIQSIYLGV